MSERTPRKPTEAMLNAARDWSDRKYGKPIGNDAAIGCWQAMFDAHTAAQPAPDAVAEAIDVLGNIAAMGYSDDPAVQANIARMAVEMARSARSTYFKGHQP